MLVSLERELLVARYGLDRLHEQQKVIRQKANELFATF